ncbi:TAXI family TRAP transporter solute-binding subunit [Tepidamorphus sp. 3E244]|uniref:TAXI family TRAP transporter solute-binding subunit n=1 Tax=Tepidamorphus sp. 3E244 TaxID=3385498 RepID=UPI0038FC6630
MRNLIKYLASCAAGAGLMMASAAQADEPVNWTLGSFIQGSSWYVYGVNIGEVLREALPEGSTVDTPPIAGGTGNPLLVSTGKANLALGIATVNTWATEGKHAYEEPLTGLRALLGGLDQYYLLPVADGENPADLKAMLEAKPKARVVLLRKGSLGSLGGQQMLGLVGAGEDELAAAGGSYEFGSFDMVKSRFASDTADVFIQVVTVGHPAITEMGQTQKMTYLQPSQETLDEMTSTYGWSQATLPAGTFPGQDKELKLPGSTTMLFTSEDMSEDHAYLVVKTICENTAKLQAAHNALKNFDCEAGEVWREEVNGIALHEGAKKYFKERGWIE